MKTKILSKEVYFLRWQGILQPVNGSKESDVKKFIVNSLNAGANIIDYSLSSNYGIPYNVKEFIKD